MRPFPKSAKHFLFYATFAGLIFPVFAQEKDFTPPQPPTPESHFLELLDLEIEPAKQIDLLRMFEQRFPKYEGMGAIYSQAQTDLVELERWDEALDYGSKLLKIDPDDLQAIKLNLEAAKGKKDAGAEKFWAARLAELTREIEGNVSATSTINTPYVESAGPVEALPGQPLTSGSPAAQRQAARTEAILFNRAVEEKGATERLDAVNAFIKAFPQSTHVNKAQYMAFLAHQDLNDRASALRQAETILQRDQTREDVLLFAADEYYRLRREPKKVLTYATLALDLVNGRLRPESVSDSDWSKQKIAVTFHAHYLIGNLFITQENWGGVDRELRAALASGGAGPGIQNSMYSSLAFANYKLRKPLEAIKIYERLAETDSGLREEALKSIKAIKAEYDLQ